RVHAQWERLLEKVPDLIRQAQKAIFAAYPTQDPDIVFWTGFYEDEFWLQDIINYRAAALVPHIMDYWQGDFSFDWSNWMGLYSYNNQAYTSLRRTLMNLPGNIPPHILSNMSLLELERPITDRVELVSLLSAVTPFDSRHANVFMYATREQLLRAFRKVADHLRQDKPLSTRKITNIVSPVIYIVDYPDVHQGNVVGLAEKSIRWHRHLQEHRTARTIDELGGDRPTALPPAVLPD